jgi:hypothetical protein
VIVVTQAPIPACQNRLGTIDEGGDQKPGRPQIPALLLSKTGS